MTLTHKLLLATVALAALAAPLSKQTDAAWSRTPVPRPAPVGHGCMFYNASVATAVALDNNTTAQTDALFQLPLQVVVTNTATSAITLCASQNPSATIDRTGRFSASGVYSAGPGPCRVFGAGVTDYFGVDSETFFRTGAGWPVGSVPSLIQQTYLMVINPAGAGSSDFFVCEVQ